MSVQPKQTTDQPESTAVRVALWRAMHVQLDAAPHVLEDAIGLQLVAPDENWRQRGDMNPQFTRGFRASIVARGRFVEDLVAESSAQQYIILGAGLDTFAQRRPDVASRMRVFEVDQPGPQRWKQRRLKELGFAVPEWLHFVPVDFETKSWWTELVKAGFDPKQRTLVTSMGVSMYLTRDAITAMLRQVGALARGSTFVMTYMLPLDLVDPSDRRGYEMAMKGAQSSGTPFISLFAPAEVLALAREAGFRDARTVSTADMIDRYFANRSDGLRPSTGEELLIATT